MNASCRFKPLNSTLYEFPGLFIHKINVATLHPARKQHAVRVLDEIDELLRIASFDNRVFRGFLVADPLAFCRVISQVEAEDHSTIIEFKSLSCVHASDLTDTIRIGRPILRLWNSGAEPRAIWFSIPRHGPIPNDNIVDETAIRRIGPWPAETGNQTAGMPFEISFADLLIKFLDAIHNAEFERVANIP